MSARSSEPAGATSGSAECRDPLAAGDRCPETIASAVDASRGSFRRLIANTRFRKLWISQFVSGVGDWLVIGLLMPLVASLSGNSAFAVAGILIAKIVPALFLSSVTGVLVDRFDRRKLMVVCDVVRAVLTLGLLFTNNLALIYLVVLLMETASLFFVPAKNALIPRLVTPGDVAAANGLSYTTQQVSLLVGLTASGAILAVFDRVVRWVLAADLEIVASLVGPFAPALLGPRAGVFVNSFTFILSGLIIASIGRIAEDSGRKREPFDVRLIGADVIESFRFLRDHNELRGLLVTIGLAILGGGAIIPVGVVFIQQLSIGPLLERSEILRQAVSAPQTFMLAFLATGMLTGGLLAPRLAKRVPLMRLFAGSVTAFGVALMVFASFGTYGVASVAALVAGASVAVVTVAGNTYVVETTSDDIRGRVFTALESVIRIALLVSMLVMATLGDIISALILRVIALRDVVPTEIYFTGPRIALQVAAMVVLGAAYYAFRMMKAGERRAETEGA